ncbi:hypothetical protein [Rhizobium sp. LjRoot254]|uniref:hypothetical protein n=1 Tax=Rhizobium sp. LjRoot254 TaxID=3342297 RepID=UPI003ECE67E7
MTTEKLVITAVMGCLAVVVMAYLIVCIQRMRSAPKALAAMKELYDTNTQAVRENSELLRELTALNKKILEKQNRSDT